MPTFLTALAPEARIKGSRDPLGLLPLWARVGRRGIGNVTTVSGDLRGWTQLLVAIGLARTYGADQGAEGITEAFFGAEQLIAHARVWTNEIDPEHASPVETNDVRGVSRARVLLRKAIAERVPVMLDHKWAEWRLLGNQRSAGVWGQIGASARASGLVHKRDVALVRDGLRLWEEVYHPRLRPFAAVLSRLLRRGSPFRPDGEHRELARVVSGLHATDLTPEESRVYRSAVLDGAHVEGGPPIQAALVNAWLERGGLDQDLDRPALQAFARDQVSRGRGQLAAWLMEIYQIEAVLGPIERLFSCLLRQPKVPINEIVTAVGARWPDPISHLSAADALLKEVSLSTYREIAHYEALLRIRDALAAGDWQAAVQGVLTLNAWVMHRRGGGPWIWQEGDKLVRGLGDGEDLPEPADRERALVHNYYLSPMRRLILAWREGSRGTH